jgi:hypothetical protein
MCSRFGSKPVALLGGGRTFKKWGLVGDLQVNESMKEMWNPGLFLSLFLSLLPGLPGGEQLFSTKYPNVPPQAN